MAGAPTHPEYRNPPVSAWLEQAQRAVQDLAALPANWDGYGSRTIQPQAVAGMFELLLSAERLHLPSPNIAPVPGGALQAEWLIGRRGLEIAVHATGAVSYLAVEADNYDNALEGELAPNDLVAFRPLVGWLFELEHP